MLYSASRLGSLLPELKATTFRKTAFGLTTAAIVGASVLASFSANAQQVRPTMVGTRPAEAVTTTTDCSKYQPGVLMADTKCEILKGQVLDTQLTKEKETLACLQKIKVHFDRGLVSRETVRQYGKERACELAKTLG